MNIKAAWFVARILFYIGIFIPVFTDKVMPTHTIAALVGVMVSIGVTYIVSEIRANARTH